MKSFLIAIVVAVGGLAGCVDSGDPVVIGTAPPFVLMETQDPNGRPVLVSDDLAGEGRESQPIEMPASVCGCETGECAKELLAETFGCGICVTVVCDQGGLRGGCLPCEDDIARQQNDHADLTATPY
jgi:hypothetical protein